MTDDLQGSSTDIATLLRSAASGAAPVLESPATARGRAVARQRRQRMTGAALTVVLVGAGALLATSLPEDQSRNVVISDPTPTASPTGVATPSAQRLELRGDDLGVTRIGANKAAAISAVSRVLGDPSVPHAVTGCPGSASEVGWARDLLLAFDGAGRLKGWAVNTSRLATPSGVRVGTTLARLHATYRARLTLLPPTGDQPTPGFVVKGVSMVGWLSGEAATDHVTELANGICTGP